MTIDFDGFDFEKADISVEKFKTYIAFEEDDKIILARLYCKDVKKNFKATNDIKFLYYDVIAEKEKFVEEFNHYETYSLITNITSKGLFGFVIAPKKKIWRTGLETMLRIFILIMMIFVLN